MRQPYGRKIASTVVYAPSRAGTPRTATSSSSRMCAAARRLGRHVQTIRARARRRRRCAGVGGHARRRQRAHRHVRLLLPGRDSVAGAGWRARFGRSKPAALCPAMMRRGRVLRLGVREAAPSRLYGGMSWALQMGAERARLAGDATAYIGRCWRLPRTCRSTRRRTAWPAVLQRHGRYTHYGDWIGNPTAGGYWDRIAPKAALAGTHRRRADASCRRLVRTQMLEGTLGAWRAMAASRAAAAARSWGLGVTYRGAAARTIRRLRAARRRARSIAEGRIRWFDHYLKDRDNGVEHEPARARCSTSARKTWTNFAAWPEPRPQALASIEQRACGGAQ